MSIKTLLTRNWFKLILTIVLLLFIGVVAFCSYFAIYLPWRTENISQEQLKLSKQCRDDGQTLFQEDKDSATRAKLNSGVVNCYYFEPAFVYSSTLNTCLYGGGYTCDLTTVINTGIFSGQHATQWNKRIVNVYTNENIDSISVEDSSNVSQWETESINEFNNKMSQLGMDF